MISTLTLDHRRFDRPSTLRKVSGLYEIGLKGRVLMISRLVALARPHG
jgi:hypothetical protein